MRKNPEQPRQGAFSANCHLRPEKWRDVAGGGGEHTTGGRAEFRFCQRRESRCCGDLPPFKVERAWLSGENTAESRALWRGNKTVKTTVANDGGESDC